MTWSTATPRSANSSSTSRYDRPYRRYHRTDTEITSDGNRKPANADTEREKAIRASVSTAAPCQRNSARHRHQEFLAFLKQVAKAHPDDGASAELHLVMDNYAAHKRTEVRDWLAANPRIRVHFTPTSGSWLNLVEVWFGIIERQAIHRGSFGSVRDLNAKIRAFVDGWNDRCHTFVWTKTADQILKKANRYPTSETAH